MSAPRTAAEVQEWKCGCRPPCKFVRRYFIEAQGMDPDDEVTRIEWRYLDGGE